MKGTGVVAYYVEVIMKPAIKLLTRVVVSALLCYLPLNGFASDDKLLTNASSKKGEERYTCSSELKNLTGRRIL